MRLTGAIPKQSNSTVQIRPLPWLNLQRKPELDLLPLELDFLYGHAYTAVIVCFLLTWCIDQKRSSIFQASSRNHMKTHTELFLMAHAISLSTTVTDGRMPHLTSMKGRKTLGKTCLRSKVVRGLSLIRAVCSTRTRSLCLSVVRPDLAL